MTAISVNPATGNEVGQFPLHSAEDIDEILASAAGAQSIWCRRPMEERIELLRSVAEVLRANRDRYARLITSEMGKPLVESIAEIEKCAWNCEFYADQAPAFLADEVVASTASESAIVYDPIGVVLAIMPWNYPFWQFFRFAAPALAAGNGAILKHSNNVSGCALACEQVFREAGAPDGLMRTIIIDSKDVAGIIADDRIAAVTLTGSTEVGAIVASQAGKVLKRQVLELGGSDPFIVLGDADVQEAAKAAVKSRFTNVGQSCVNAKRFIIEQTVAEQFVSAFCAGVADLKVGDPLDAGTNIGPMARADLRDTLHSQVVRSVAAGAKLVIGGAFIERSGFYYSPTVLDQVTPEMPAFNEETFGPVAAIIRAKSANEAISLANKTEFGLGATLWTRNVEKARALARCIEAGAVFINGMVSSDPRLPFGGIKRSGYGRELGYHGIREFTNIKTIWIGPAKPSAGPTPSK
jgi:succinate-semialdehyde dehydrogenase/glutarate-semialdehyde dehydrogenase